MKTKLIMVEGIPGSGKSTLAGKISTYLRDNGHRVCLYTEASLHPADLAWCAYVERERYDEILLEYPGLAEQIMQNTLFEDDRAVIAYTRVKADATAFYETMSSYEVYDARVDYEKFKRISYKRWGTFAGSAQYEDAVSIFECAFFQNHVEELLGFRDADDAAILEHLVKLAKTVGELNPALIYLDQSSVEAKVESMARDRVSEGLSPNWIDMAVRYTEQSPYGRKHGLAGREGLIAFFKKRREIELMALRELPLKTMVVGGGGSWADIWLQIEAFLNELEEDKA